MAKMTKDRFVLVLSLVILTGALLRFFNLNWDQGLSFHPDERNINAAYSKINFPNNLNPEFFAYGSSPIYLYRVTGELISYLKSNTSYLTNWGKISLIGRRYSAFFSTLLIMSTYFLAKKLFSNKVAFISVLLSSFTAGYIQIAHFSITESAITFFGTVICLVSIYIAEKGHKKLYLVAGILLGIAASFKTSSLSYFILPLAGHLIYTSSKKVNLNLIKKGALNLTITLVSSVSVYTLLSPYTFLAWDKFIESMKYESGVVSGNLPVPYTLQFTNTTPYLFQIKNMLWQLGPVYIVALIGFLHLSYKSIKERKKYLYIFLIFPIAYFAYVGSWHTKFIRYMMPILPFLIISSAYFLDFLKKEYRLIGKVLSTIFITLTILWGLAFFSIYLRPQTRIQASRYIYQNIPPGSTLLKEHWDDGLPLNLSGKLNKRLYMYNINTLEIYDNENPTKVNYYAERLSSADYILINSRRLYGTLINLPTKYPVTSYYYKLLFNGDLGYKKVAEFTSYPSILGITIDDSSSEETFQVYDHPKVIIFKNTKNLSEEKIRQKLSKYSSYVQ